MVRSHAAKTVLIGAQGISCNKGIPAIVFCSRNRVPVAEAIQLLGIDREYGVVMFQQGLYHRSARNFDGNRECRRFAIGQCLQEVTELEHAGATMFDAALADLLPLCIQDAGLVELHSPVHSNVEVNSSFMAQPPLVMALDLRSQRQPCTGAHSTCGWRKLPTGLSATGHPTGRCSVLGALVYSLAGVLRGTPDGRPSCLST